MYTENKKEPSINKKAKRILLTLTLSTLLLFAICSFLIKPLYISLNANVLYRNTVWIPIIEMLILVLENLAFALCFASAVYSLFKFTARKAISVFSVCAGTLLFKNLSAFIADSVSVGYISSSDLLLNLLWFAIDLVKLIAVILISQAIIKSFYKRSAAEGIKNRSPIDEIFERRFFFSKHNPLCTSALTAALVILSTELYSETRYYIYNGFFASFKYTVWMISDYLLDILIGCMIYAVSLYVFLYFISKEESTDIKA